MKTKTAAAYLTEHAPGWDSAPNAGHHVKATTDPKVRGQCLQALAVCQSAPPPRKSSKAKGKSTATASTTTTKSEG